MEMRDMIWIYAAFVLFSSEAWSQKAGTNETSENSNNSTSPDTDVDRHLAFNLGNNADLICSDKTWNETLFIIWNIKSNNKECRIAFSDDGRSEDTCQDGKSLQNTSSAQSYLHIPNFSNGDVGVYKCECVYNGGVANYRINVAITVPPKVSSWLERKNDKMVAVCKAEKGKPAANISWTHWGNSSSLDTRHDSHGFFTVESRLELAEGMDAENLRCLIRHQYWDKAEILAPEPLKDYAPLGYISIGVAIIMFLAGFLFFAQKKQMILRRCQKSETSPPKSAPTEDVEEVEPYASYVQRVNSIYNSSADLFS